MTFEFGSDGQSVHITRKISEIKGSLSFSEFLNRLRIKKSDDFSEEVSADQKGPNSQKKRTKKKGFSGFWHKRPFLSYIRGLGHLIF